jgi:N-acetylmuramoyl-L-alanine amidase
MLATAYYFLQVVICSAIMMGYYWLVLRNKRFHQYNRFYLLAVALLSWLVPLIKIQWSNAQPAAPTQVMYLLNVVADSNTEWEQVVQNTGFHWSRELLLTALYFLVAGFLLVMTLHAIHRIYQLLRKHSCRTVDDIYLIITQAKGTPFSFFRYIFWNEEIDIRSESGKQILQHELTHVRQKHSVDKLLLQVVIIVGWFNPFFWLLKREMELIHEFIADHKAVKEGDTAALAQMLLAAAYPRQQFMLTNPFFFSPIKRRLQMLKNHNNPRFSYLRRLVVLPMLAVVVVLFAFRSAEQKDRQTLSMGTVMESVVNQFSSHDENEGIVFEAHPSAAVKLMKKYRVVINPGHGGTDKGAMAPDGTTEAALSLAMAEMFRKVNTNDQIEIILTRETDQFSSLVEVGEKVTALAPDLFISMHVNSESGKASNKLLKGAELFIASKDKAVNYTNNYELANAVASTLKSVTGSTAAIKSREKGIYLLQSVPCPAVLVEAGYITNQEDLTKLKNPVYQEQLARAILQGVTTYLSQKEGSTTAQTYAMPFVAESADVFTAVSEVGQGGGNPVQFSARALNTDTIPAREKEAKVTVRSSDGERVETVTLRVKPLEKDVLYIVDGKEANPENFSSLNPEDISAIHVVKNEEALAAYGEKARNGVIEVYTKSVTGYAPLPNPVAGEYGFETSDITAFKKKNSSVQRVSWSASPMRINIDLKDGSRETYDLEKAASKSKAVAKYGELPAAPPPPPGIKGEAGTASVGRVMDGIKFNGGISAWTKFLSENIDQDILKRKGAPAKFYTVMVSFSLDANGEMSDVRAIADPGFGLADEAVKVVKKSSGKWIPANAKGKSVKANQIARVVFKES